MAQTMVEAPRIAGSIAALEGRQPGTPRAAATGHDADLTLIATTPEANSALEDWRRRDR
jgi:hypothetical protein